MSEEANDSRGAMHRDLESLRETRGLWMRRHRVMVSRRLVWTLLRREEFIGS